MDRILSSFQRSNEEVLIAGDFNIDLLKTRERAIFNDFLEIFLTNGFKPKITFPTRITHQTATLIDNIFVKLSDKFSKTTSGILLNDISDHQPCFISLDFMLVIKEKVRFIKVWNTSSQSIASFTSDVENKISFENFAQSLDTDPNLNYNILDGHIIP